MTGEWEKPLTLQLRNLGLSWEQARMAVGIVAEQRQIADREGYVRGYNNGYRDAEEKLTEVKE